MKTRNRKELKSIGIAKNIAKLTGEPAKPWTHRQHRKNRRKSNTIINIRIDKIRLDEDKREIKSYGK